MTKHDDDPMRRDQPEVAILNPENLKSRNSVIFVATPFGLSGGAAHRKINCHHESFWGVFEFGYRFSVWSSRLILPNFGKSSEYANSGSDPIDFLLTLFSVT